jgi:hypothetical protein
MPSTCKSRIRVTRDSYLTHLTSTDLHHVGVSRITCWRCQRNNATGIPISRYEKPRLKSQPLNQDQIWTVDSSPGRSFEDRVLKLSKNIHHRNPDFVICEIAMKYELSDQALIWTVDSGLCQSFRDRNMEWQVNNATRMMISQYEKS